MKASFKNRYVNSSGLKKVFWSNTLFIVCSIGSFAWGNSDVHYPGVVSIQTSNGYGGTGFFYSRPDIIVTAFHVIAKLLDNRKASLKDSISLYHRLKAKPIPVEDIEIIAMDAKYDLAVLKIKGFRSDTFYLSHPNTDLRSLELDSEIKVVGFSSERTKSILKGLTLGDANYDYPGSGSFIGFEHDKEGTYTGGMSGGPVFLASDNSVIGVYIEGKNNYKLLGSVVGLNVFVSVNNLQLMLQNPSLSCRSVACIRKEFQNLRTKASLGDRQSQYKLAAILLKMRNYQAFYWYTKGAQDGHPNAQFILSIILLILLNDTEGSRYWLNRSVDQDHLPAKRLLKRIQLRNEETLESFLQ